METLEEMIDRYYGQEPAYLKEPAYPTWTLEQLVEAERAMVVCIKKYRYLPIANLWLGPLVTKWALESGIPKKLTPEEEAALVAEHKELTEWLKEWIDTHEGML